MFKKIIFSAGVLSILLACNLQAEQIHSTWVGGESGSWEDAANWNPPLVPENNPTWSFVVIIDGGTDDACEVGIQESHTIDRLDTYQRVELRNWGSRPIHLNFPTPPLDENCLTNHGVLRFKHVGEYIKIYGNVKNTAGATMEIQGETIVNNGNLENRGVVTIIPVKGSLWVYPQGELHNFGQINNYGGICDGDRVFDNSSTGTINGFGTIYAGLPFVNNGTIYASGGSLTIATGGAVSNIGTLGNSPMAFLNIIHFVQNTNVNNSGTIEVNAGGGVGFNCSLINEPNGTIKLLGGTLAGQTITQKADANFAGFGGISGDVVIDNDGLIKLTGPTNIVGDVEIKNDATLEISDGLTLITGQTTCNGTIHIKGGYVIPQGGLSGNCNVIWEPGLYINVADFNLDGKVNLEDFAYFADTWLWQTAWR